MIPHSPYNPDIAPSDFFLVWYPQRRCEHQVSEQTMVNKTILHWHQHQDAEFFTADMQKHVEVEYVYNWSGSYIEK